MKESDELRMDAYYYSFQPTGVREIDRILSAVATAGKRFHHTQDWSDEMEMYENKSCVDLIQEAANAAAEAWQKERDDYIPSERKAAQDNYEFLIQSRDFVLQAFNRLAVTYGEQKHKIRELEAALEDMKNAMSGR